MPACSRGYLYAPSGASARPAPGCPVCPNSSPVYQYTPACPIPAPTRGIRPYLPSCPACAPLRPLPPYAAYLPARTLCALMPVTCACVRACVHHAHSHAIHTYAHIHTCIHHVHTYPCICPPYTGTPIYRPPLPVCTPMYM